MKKIMLYAHGSSANHGCEAIVRSTCQALDLSPDNSILFSDDITSDLKYGLDNFIKVESTSKRDFFDYVRLVAYKLTKNSKYLKNKNKYLKGKYALALSIGGDNYCYRGLLSSLIEKHKILKSNGTKTVLWGASFIEKTMRPEVIEDLKTFDLITARESESIEILKKHGITDNVVATFDTAFLLKPQEVQWPDKKEHTNIVGINISPLISCYEQADNVLFNNYKKLIDYILTNTDMEIALIPHVVLKGTDDREPLRQLYEEFNSDRIIMLNDDYNCCELKYLISKCRVFVGARTHATIAAYSSFVPTLVMGYSTKAVGIAKDLFGTTENFIVNSNKVHNDEDLLNAFKYILENEKEIAKQLKLNVPKQIKKIENAVSRFKQLLN